MNVRFFTTIIDILQNVCNEKVNGKAENKLEKEDENENNRIEVLTSTHPTISIQHAVGTV